MALIDGRRKTVTLPHRQGHSVTIHQVPGRVLRIAQQRRRLHDSRGARMPLAATDNIAEGGSLELATTDETGWNALNQFDIDTLLRAAVVQWTFREPISAEALEMIDWKTKLLVAAEIIALSSRG